MVEFVLMHEFNEFRIFPIPVFTCENVKQITKEELYVATNELNVYKGCEYSERKISIDTYILERKEYKNLKKVLTEKLNSYFQEVFAPRNKDLELYITQSWLNYNEKGAYHHPHYHTNSIVSGVFYLKANKELDQICFEKKFSPDYLDTLAINIEKETTNDFNAEKWGVIVDSSLLIMFPSTLTHTVQQIEHDESRISLAFNTFIRGTIGTKDGLNELHLL